MTLKASTRGRTLIEKAIAEVGEGKPKSSSWWLDEADKILAAQRKDNPESRESVSGPTWKRFYLGESVRPEFFKAFCTLLKLNWEEIADLSFSDVRLRIFEEKLQDSDRLAFGHHQTTWIVKDGTGESSYTPENILCYYKNDELILPKELERIRKEIEKEQESSSNKKTQISFWNGPRYYFDKYKITRTSREENPRLELWFGPSDYYNYLATNQRLHDKQLRETYLPEQWDQPVQYFSNAFATYIAAITEDNYLIISQRSKNVGSRPGEFNISANEGLSRHMDHVGGVPDLFSCATRGIKEELGCSVKYNDVRMLSFGVDALLGHWALLGTVQLKETKEEIQKKRSRGVHDKWENQGIDFMEFDLENVITTVLNIKPWAPAAIACIYHTLVYNFGRDKCDSTLDKLSKSK